MTERRRSSLSEKFTTDPTMTVLARLAVLATPLLGSAVFALLTWFGSEVWDDLRAVTRSVARIEATIGSSMERGIARDRRMDRIEAVNQDQQADLRIVRNLTSNLQGRVLCLEHDTACPEIHAPPPF